MGVKIIKSYFHIIGGLLTGAVCFLGACGLIFYGQYKNFEDILVILFTLLISIICCTVSMNRLYFYNDYMVIRQFPRKYRLEYSAIKRIFSTGLFGYVITLRDGKNYMVFMPYITKKLKEQFLDMQKTYSDIEIYL